jgi:hypothetical protein
MTGERAPVLRRRRSGGDGGEPDGAPPRAETGATERETPPAAPPERTGRVVMDRERSAPSGRVVVERDRTPGPTSSARGAPARDAGRPAVVGRRAYDPRAERGQGPLPAPSGVPVGANARGKGKKFGARPSISEEKLALRNQAQNLAKEKNIPLIHAYRILKGQTTLNEVLKAMMRKERFEQMITREGIDRELAGQVASGHLSKQRAVLLTRMRTLRKQKLHIDGIKAAEIEKQRVAVDFFGTGWVIGRVRNVRPYEFDFFSEQAEKSERFFKHDVKALCAAEDLPAVLKAMSLDEKIKAEGLAATEDRAARIRPDDETLLRAIETNRIVRFTMRDGELMLGRVRSFGRWDAELCLEGGEIITVFFHGLHAASKSLGYSA